MNLTRFTKNWNDDYSGNEDARIENSQEAAHDRHVEAQLNCLHEKQIKICGVLKCAACGKVLP